MLPLRLVKTAHKILSMNLTIKFKQFLREGNIGFAQPLLTILFCMVKICKNALK